MTYRCFVDVHCFIFSLSYRNVQIILWLIIWWKPVPALVILSKAFFAGVSLFAALGFLLYGGRLFLMLRRFPVESKGRQKKLQEMCFNAFDEAADLDVLYHPILNFVYYLEVASKARDHTVPPYSLIQQWALDDGNQALGSGYQMSWLLRYSSYLEVKMIIHPDGDGDGADHISVYLAIIGPSSLHGVWEVNASFSFLIFDQIHDNYTAMKVMERRFRSIKTEWGLSKCISHETFKNPSNGYLVNDKCIVGVDVYVIKNHGIGECLSLLNDSNVYKHEWKITEFTKLKNEVYSGEFTVEGYKWKLSLYPTGDSRQNGQSISVFLESVDAKGFDRHKSGVNWYSAAAYSWDWSSFMPCSEINDPKKGFLIKDCCIVESDVSVVAVDVASKVRDHTVPPYSLIQQCALDDGNQALGSGYQMSWLLRYSSYLETYLVGFDWDTRGSQEGKACTIIQFGRNRARRARQ
ncbi:hypothetical protein H5410_064399, partial [Solanum commersonii]